MKESPIRWLRKIYRKEPVSAFIVTFGLIDAILGGFGERWSLLSFGMLMIIMGLFMAWVQLHKTRKPVMITSARRYLPPSPNGLTPLPPLKRKRDYRL